MPRPEPTLGVRALQPLISGLRALGRDPAPILKAVELDEALLADPDGRIPAHVMAGFWAAALQATADQDLGLHIAERADVSSFDLHAYAFFSSPTLGAAIERMAAYQRLMNDTNRILVERRGAEVAVRHVRPGGLNVGRQTAEFLLAVWTRFVDLSTAAEIAPVEIRFAHAMPGDTSEHSRILRGPLRFAAGENAVVLPVAALATPCVRADPGLVAVLDRHAVDRLGRLPQGHGLADRVRSALAEELQLGQASAVRVAERLRMSARTLSRTLAAEGTSYRDVLEQLRRELAFRHLEGGQVAIAEVAFLLGFAEIGAFYRAFRRWTGQTPAEYRRQRQRRA